MADLRTALEEAFNRDSEEKPIEEPVEEVSEETLEEKKIATGTGKKVMPSAKERSNLAKRARAGEDIGKKGKGFEKIADKAAEKIRKLNLPTSVLKL